MAVTPGTCPRCGGRQRLQIAPGFFECTTEAHVGMAPGPGRGVPIFRACGEQYQDGSGAVNALCKCGLGAIGRCKRCSTAVCGRHSHMIAEELLCADHAAAARTAHEKGRARQAQAKAAADRQAAEQYEAGLQAVVPGFPTRECTGTVLAASLEKLVPSRNRSVVLEWRRFGSKRASGWLFLSQRWHSSEPNRAGAYTVRWGGYFVSLDGRVFGASTYEVADKFSIDELLSSQRRAVTFSDRGASYLLSVDDLNVIRPSVINWRR